MNQLTEEANDTTGSQSAFRQRKHLFIQSRRGRIEDINEIPQDDVKRTRTAGQKLDDIAYVDPGARIVEAPSVQIDEMPLAGLDHKGVYVHENDFLDSRITKNLAKSQAVSTTLYQNTSGIRVKEQRGKGQMFVVDVLVELEELDDSIQKQATAELGNAYDSDFLMGRSLT